MLQSISARIRVVGMGFFRLGILTGWFSERHLLALSLIIFLPLLHTNSADTVNLEKNNQRVLTGEENVHVTEDIEAENERHPQREKGAILEHCLNDYGEDISVAAATRFAETLLSFVVALVESHARFASLHRRDDEAKLQQTQRPHSQDNKGEKRIRHDLALGERLEQLDDIRGGSEVREQELRLLVSREFATWQQPSSYDEDEK